MLEGGCLGRGWFVVHSGNHDNQEAADVWEKNVWEFQAKSGSSGFCCLFLHFLGKIAVQEMSGKTPGSPRRPSSRHPRPSETTHGTHESDKMDSENKTF